MVIKDSFFEFHTVYTDDLGCFKVDNRHYGRAHMWVHFRSKNRVKIRGTRAGFFHIFEWLGTLRNNVGTLHGPVFNNVDVKYDLWQNQGSSAHLYWGAATVGNSLHEFIDYAIVDNINQPPLHLDIYVGKNHTYGYALLSGQDDIAETGGALIGGITFFTGPFAPLIALISYSALEKYLPDVYVGINYRNSDRLKRLAYHEIAHASHFTNVGPIYWDQVVWSEIFAGGHGNSSSMNAGLISIVESWADHIGYTFTHTSYPNVGVNSAPPGYGNWVNFLEQLRNETSDHIPIGFSNDLNDNNIDQNFACDFLVYSCGPIQDNINGITNGQMFNLLTPNIYSPLEFKVRLLEITPSNLHLHINNLFNSY